MRKKSEDSGGMATLAVLAAAAREAEELLSVEVDLEQESIAEANRRLKLFMQTARQMAR